MRVLITGGCGFIGAAVVRAAVERGHRVLNIDRRGKRHAVPALAAINGREGYARIEADVADRALMRALFGEFQPERVIHLAAATNDDPDALFDVDIAGAFSVMEASRRHIDRLDDTGRSNFRLVHAIRASAETESDHRPAPREAASASAAAMLDGFARSWDLPLVTCSAHEVFGPWQADTTFLPSLIAAIAMGRPFPLEAAGERMRDWLPVADFASGLLRAAEAGAPFARYEFSAGAERRDLDIAESVATFLDARCPRGAGPWSELIDLTGQRRDARPAPMLDAQAAETDLKWQPGGFHTGLDRALNWMLQRFPPIATPALAAE
ncbi:MAG: NAD-dependent epimerase/dehydratase family protein [Alphaproteobacteria bacterium]